MTSKKKKKIKASWFKMKRELKYQKTPVILLVGLLLFPLVVGLIYKIISIIVNVEIGNLLSFYAVALGIFASFLTYRETEKHKALARQEFLRPRIELSFELHNNENQSKVCIKNITNNDYVIDFFECDNYEDNEIRYLNAQTPYEFVIESCEKIYPELIYVGIKDIDGNEWAVGFEYISETIKYRRTFTEIIA